MPQTAPALSRKATAIHGDTPAPDHFNRSLVSAPAGLPLFLQRRALNDSKLPAGDAAGGLEEEEESGAPLQAKLEINQPGDIFEQEADAVAEHISAAPKQSHFSEPAHFQESKIVQRKCATCPPGAPCPECAEEEDEHPVQRKSNSGVHAGFIAKQALQVPDTGSPLDPGFRHRLEPVLGADLAGVRLHSSPAAQATAAQINAKAFTHGSDIWLGPNQSATDFSLVAHETTHVVQQRAAPPIGATAQSAAPAARSATAPAVQRDDEPGLLDRVVGVGESAVGAVVDVGVGAVETVAELGADAVDAALRAISPGLADLVAQGPLNFVKNLVERAIGEWLPSLLGGFDPIGAVVGFAAGIGEVFGTIAGLAKGDAKSCAAFARMLGGLRDLGSALMESTAVQTLREAFSAVYSAISSVVKVVATPVFDAVASLLGGAWGAIKGAAKTVSGWIQSAKDLAGRAWDWAAKKLGLVGSDGEEGILDWIKRKAGEVWDAIKETFAPAIGPLKKVIGVLSLFTGLGQIYVLVKYGPKLVEAVTWLWDHRNDPNIIANAREQMKDSILPQLLEGVAGFKGAIDSAIGWLTGTLTSLTESLLELVGGIAGVPLLSMAQSAIQSVADAATELMTWAGTQLTAAGEWFAGIYQRVAAFLAPYQEILSSIGLAIVNPPMIPVILAGWAWEALPNCIKGPVIDFLLDLIIGALAALPDLPMFGPLWSLLKPGILGFLQQVRSQPMEAKVTVSNKVAKIIRGSSLGFLYGFAKGVLVGVWEGISDPIKGIWMIAKGVTWVIDYLDALTNAALAGTATPTPASPFGGGEGQAVRIKREDAAPITTQPAPAAAPAAPANAIPGELAAEASGFASAVRPDVDVAVGNFWDAAQEYFSGSGGVSFDELAQKLGDAWSGLQAKAAELGDQMASKVMGFFVSDAEADDKLGEGVGWLVGNIGFQLLLDYFSAGTWEGIGRVLQVIARFLNWPMEVLGAAFKLLKKLGGMILDGIKSLGRMVVEAGGGALRKVMGAFGSIGEKLMSFSERLLGKFGGAAAREGEHVAAAEGTKLAEKEIAKTAEAEGLHTAETQGAHAAEKPGAGAAKEAEEAAGAAEHQSPATREHSVEESSHLDSPELSQKQLDNEMQHLGENPGALRGSPPNRTAKIGDHTWTEKGNGWWCRASNPVCTKLPEDLEKLLQELPPPRTGPVKEGEAVPYKESTVADRGVKGDQLTGDHIPSRAALVEHAQQKRYQALSQQLGRPLTPAELAQNKLTQAEMDKIKNEGITAVIKEDVHRAASPTYGGRNNPAQIAKDASDLAAAVHRDVEAALNAREAAGQLTRDWVKTYLHVYQENVNRGLIKYSAETNQLFLDFLARAK